MSAAEGQASFSAPELPTQGFGGEVGSQGPPPPAEPRGMGWSVGSHLHTHPELLESGPGSRCCLVPRGQGDHGSAAASKAAHTAPQPGAPAG